MVVIADGDNLKVDISDTPLSQAIVELKTAIDNFSQPKKSSILARVVALEKAGDEARLLQYIANLSLQDIHSGMTKTAISRWISKALTDVQKSWVEFAITTLTNSDSTWTWEDIEDQITRSVNYSDEEFTEKIKEEVKLQLQAIYKKVVGEEKTKQIVSRI